ncbi:MAG: hypothetical protein AAFZ80_09465 [Cyanobacteria bacterium P01_A01_bin.105]
MGSDVLILTIYFLVVIYVLYQMALSLESQLEEKVKVSLNLKDSAQNVQAQLTKAQSAIQAKVSDSGSFAALLLKATGGKPSDLKKVPHIPRLEITIPETPEHSGKITLNAGPTGKLSKQALQMRGRHLTLDIDNRTLDTQVFVDWDRSSITYLSANAKRAIRIASNMSWDPQYQQVFSVVNPSERLQANVTTEKSFVRNADTQQIEPKKPLLNVEELVAFAAPDMKGFESMQKRGMFSLNVMLGLRRLAEQAHLTTYLLVPLNFNVELLEDEIAFPPLRWLLERPDRRPGEMFNTMVLGRRGRR